MADVPAPVYPSFQPPAQNNTNALAGDPTKIVGLLSGLQDFRLKQQQFDALAQQPAAALQGQNIANTTATMTQQAAASRAASTIIATYLAGHPNPTEKDVRDAKAYAARSLPSVAVQYPEMIPGAADVVLNHPKGIKFGAATLLNSQLSPDSASSLVDGPPNPATGAPTKMTVPQSNLIQGRDTGLAPGVAESAKARTEDLLREGATYPTEINNLKQALHYVQVLPKGSTGPLAEKFNDAKARLVELGILPQRDAENLSNFQQLQKYVARSVSDRANTMGPHTNEGLASATSGTPNAHMTDLALEPLLKASIAIRHMEHAAVVVPAQSGGPNYATEKANFGTHQDPRAYAIEMMSPEEIRALHKSIKDPVERARFNKSYQAAIAAGILKKPGE